MAVAMTNRVAGAAAAEVSAVLGELAARVRAGVVRISDRRGAGAGTIWRSDEAGSLIVTNYHVVPGQRARVTTADGTALPGEVVANLPERDLAVIQVEARGLPALPVGDSGALRAGELVVAVGHPLGIQGAVSLGIFSGVGPIEGRGGRHFAEALLADIELRPGNSGGPLVNARGEVIGINAMVLGPRTALAVPSATVLRLLGARTRRVLGVQVVVAPAPPALAARHGLAQDVALLLARIEPGSAADRVGLLPGDLLLALNGRALQEPGDLAWGLMELPAGEAATLRILRGGTPLDVAVVPEERRGEEVG